MQVIKKQAESLSKSDEGAVTLAEVARQAIEAGHTVAVRKDAEKNKGADWAHVASFTRGRISGDNPDGEASPKTWIARDADGAEVGRFTVEPGEVAICIGAATIRPMQAGNTAASPNAEEVSDLLALIEAE